MTFRFNPALGTILVPARLVGPIGPTWVVLCLDTGSTGTAIGVNNLAAAGYDPAQFPAPVPLATGGGMVYAPRIPVSSFEALGLSRTNYPVVAHTLPIPSGVDGVLGIDFFEGTVLTIDFVKGEITLASGGPTP